MDFRRSEKESNIEDIIEFGVNYDINNTKLIGDGVCFYTNCHRPRFWRWMRVVAIFVAILFTWQQITWAQGGTPVDIFRGQATDDGRPSTAAY